MPDSPRADRLRLLAGPSDSGDGPTLPELARQALSATERGYDLLAPKFDATPFRTPETVLDATARTLRHALGPSPNASPNAHPAPRNAPDSRDAPDSPVDSPPGGTEPLFARGLDLCCGTGAGLRVIRGLCQEPPVGLDFSAGMLERARAAEPTAHLVRADARALPLRPAGFDLVVSFGAFGHFLPREQPALFRQILTVLRPGGVFAFPLGRFPRFGGAAYWQLTAFDAAMRVRNALWRPPFVMYYRTFRLRGVHTALRAAGFRVRVLPLLGADGVPSDRAGLILAERPRRI